MCECVSESVCPKTCRHIGRCLMNVLIMKLCMYVGYRDANNVSNVGGDPMTQINVKTFYSIIYAVLRTWRSIALTRSQFLRQLLCDHAQTSAVWKVIPKYSSIVISCL